MANSALLAAALGLVLVLLLALGVQFLGGGDILLPASACYLAWLAQETMRRCLLANFRYRAAVAGDAVSFIGQAVVIALMAWLGSVTLSLGALHHVADVLGRRARPCIEGAFRTAEYRPSDQTRARLFCPR